MHEMKRHPGNDEVESAIADVGDMPLESLIGTDDSVLINTVQWVVEELGRPGESYAAHGSTT